MTAMFVTAEQVREYLNLEGTTGRYSNDLLGSNIRAAGAFLQRTTGRQFEPQSATTKTFTTNGASAVRIPDLRSVTSATLQGAALTADESYWLIPDNRGSFTTFQLRPFGTGSYLANPEWFDRNLDRWWSGYRGGSLPNDLVIVGDWGYLPYPEELLHACKVLAAWYTKRPASVLANVAVTAEGTELRYSDLPPEVTNFIGSWLLGTELVAL